MMIKIAEVVKDLLLNNEVALESYRKGLLNLSSFADLIKPDIEKRLYKPIKKGTVVTALSRMANELPKIPPLKPEIYIQDISIKSPLIEITYEKSTDNINSITKVTKLSSKYQNLIFSITQGVGEISLIAHQSLKQDITAKFNTKPKGIYTDLVAITIRFDESKYIEVPNMIYTLVASIATKRINLIEIVSTFTEISFIVRQTDMRATIDILNANFFN